MSDDTNKQVRYGDQIYIEISDIQPPPKTETRLLSSNSFSERDVFAVKADDFHRTDFRSCIFTVLPSLVDAQEETDILNSLESGLSFLSANEPEAVGRKYLDKEIKGKKNQMETNWEIINALNRNISNEMENKPAQYGDAILAPTSRKWILPFC